LSRFLAWAMDAKMTSNPPASTGLGINGMARSVLFFSFIFLISGTLALLYIFGFFRLFIAILCLTTLFILYLLFHPRNQWLVANRSRVDGAGCVALTFDDGPDPVYTPKLLDLLREKDVKATFLRGRETRGPVSGNSTTRLGRRTSGCASRFRGATRLAALSRSDRRSDPARSAIGHSRCRRCQLA
jgi:hypothetical protein